MTYYEVLEIDSRASTDDVERAFRRLARKVHPDLNAGDPAKAEARMKQLNEIRDTLTDPLLRVGYDERLRLETLQRERAAPPRAEWPAAARPASPAPDPTAGAPAEAQGDADAPQPSRAPWALMGLLALGAGALATVLAVFPRSGTGPAGPSESASADAAAGDNPGPPSAPGASGATSSRLPGASPGPEARATRKGRGRGVVRLGSSTDDVLRSFGPPDKLETGPRPGDAVLHYGALRLEMRNGRVVGGDAAAR
jgi:curved DNA-binding protein CbpA